MKTGSRSAIATAVLCLLFCAAARASEQVSLVSLDATRTSTGAQLDIRTSAPANLKVDRFALGDYIFVWAPEFSGPPGADSIPLELDKPDLGGFVSSVSLARDGRRNGIKIVLGPAARRQGAFLMQDGSQATLIIPSNDRVANAAEALAGPATDAPAETASAQIPAVPPAPASWTEESPEVSQDESSDSAGGAFFIPRGAGQVGIGDSAQSAEPSDADITAVEDAAAPLVGAEQTADQPEEVQIDARPTSLANVFNPAANALADQPAVNYQIVKTDGLTMSPVMPPRDEDSDKNAANQAKEAERPAGPAEAAEPAAQPSGSTYKYSGVPPGRKASNPLGTSGANAAYNPYLADAMLSTGEMPAAPLVGKDSLNGVMIELFEIVNTPLDQALTLLVAPTEFNIIVDASISSNLVSLSFKESKTDLRSALDLLTRTYGLDYVVEANTIVVAPKEKVAKELAQRENRLYVLSYSDPKRVKSILDKLGIVPADQIVVYGGEDFSDGAGAKSGGGSAGGGALGGLLGAAGGGGSDEGGDSAGVKGFTTGQAAREIQSNLSSTPPNSIMVNGTKEQLDKIDEVIKTIDRRPKVIELEVRVCEATQTALSDLGIVAQDPLGSGQSQGVTETWSESPDNNRFEAFSLSSMLRSGLSLTARLNTLQEEGKLETLAQPVLSTVEDKQANYFAGERIPYVKSISVTNNTVTQTVEFLDVGITLAFKPRLDADGSLTIQVEPTISSLIEFVDLTSNTQAPRTLSRNVQAMVRVHDCEPFVLAGLITTREKETMSKIPILADLPLVGRMFRNKNKDNQRTEVIVIVTPHVK